ncbi:hypothetical protein BD626DRAFT_482680 [Schizophyllum amplum]|uniref:Uncharacterized protein n=1 Tax=Schizophyllum amplum TaxID=97359 RepID=A0A550CVE7_9AGAR|nr:hypothetical protein BD626DRAFT_482680 [Auriculariopsis ampla]
MFSYVRQPTRANRATASLRPRTSQRQPPLSHREPAPPRPSTPVLSRGREAIP